MILPPITSVYVSLASQLVNSQKQTTQVMLTPQKLLFFFLIHIQVTVIDKQGSDHINL